MGYKFIVNYLVWILFLQHNGGYIFLISNTAIDFFLLKYVETNLFYYNNKFMVFKLFHFYKNTWLFHRYTLNNKLHAYRHNIKYNDFFMNIILYTTNIHYIPSRRYFTGCI